MKKDVKTLLIGLPETSERIAEQLARFGIKPEIIPVVKVKMNWKEVRRLRTLFESGFRPEVTIFTSKTAATIISTHIPEILRDATYLLAIGPGTASQLEKFGRQRVGTPSRHSSQGLIDRLLGMPGETSLALYCSSDVNPVLERFIKERFENGSIFKLYSIETSHDGIRRLRTLISSHPSQQFVIVLTSQSCAKALLNLRAILGRDGIMFSAISERVAREAGRLGLKIFHTFKGRDIRRYSVSLAKYISSIQ